MKDIIRRSYRNGMAEWIIESANVKKILVKFNTFFNIFSGEIMMEVGRITKKGCQMGHPF